MPICPFSTDELLPNYFNSTATYLTLERQQTAATHLQDLLQGSQRDGGVLPSSQRAIIVQEEDTAVGAARREAGEREQAVEEF
eukprot:1148543-Pelagomonas_calceolata.AAC.8